MKNILTVIALISIFAVACQAPDTESLEGKRKVLAEMKKELRALEGEVAALEKEILKLDPPKEKIAVQVDTQRVRNQNFERTIELQAQVEADDVVNVSSEIGGIIMSLNVDEGDYVKRGQVVATTDLSTMEKQIAEIETNLSLANTVFERQKRLWDQNIGSEIQYLQAKTNKESLEKSLETLNSQIKKKNIYAPISGIVDMKFLSAGELAAPGMPIIQILNTSQVKITADVQEQYLGTLKRGDEIEIYFPSLDKTLRKKISLIGRTIDKANRTFKIEMNTNSMNGLLKPNLLAIVRFVDYAQEDALVVPLEAIQEEVNGDKYVYLVKQKDGKQRGIKSYIEIGESKVGSATITKGVAQGDILVTKGAKKLSEGDPVSF